MADADTGRWADLGLIAGGNFAQLGVRTLISPLVPFLLLEFDTTKSTIGAVLTGMWAIYALLQFPSGVLADRYGERTLLLTGLAGALVGVALVAFAPTLAVFAACILVLGAGAGLYFAPASALISRLYAEHGAPLGTMTAAGAVATVVYPAAGTLVAARYDWQTAAALGAASGVPVFLAMTRYLPVLAPSNPNRRLSAALDPGRVRALLSRRRVAFTVLLGVLVGFCFQALVSFFPVFLVEHRGIDPTGAGLIFAVLYGLSAVAQPVAGRISDRFTRDTAIALSVTTAATGLTVLLATTGRPGLVVGTALLGAGISWPGVLQARFLDQFAAGERGYGFGLVRTVYMLVAASGSVVVGTLADLQGWTVGYGLVVLLFVACFGALVTNRVLSLDL